MKNNEKNSSKQVTNNVETLSVETLKAQLKAACANMNAKETKEYIKGLDGYELRLTGQRPTQHYTVFYGEVRVCNVEQVQGIKADGTGRGCVSTVKVNFLDKVNSIFAAACEKIQLTDVEIRDAESAFESALDNLQAVQSVFAAANERAANDAKEAAKAKREAASKEKAQRKMNNKLRESSDNEKIAALATVLDITFEEAKVIFEKKRAQITA